MKVKVEFTVEVDHKAYADYYDVSPTDYGCKSLAQAVRTDIRKLMACPEYIVPHLFEVGIIA
jgi:hypothetical protein